MDERIREWSNVEYRKLNIGINCGPMKNVVRISKTLKIDTMTGLHIEKQNKLLRMQKKKKRKRSSTWEANIRSIMRTIEKRKENYRKQLWRQPDQVEGKKYEKESKL